MTSSTTGKEKEPGSSKSKDEKTKQPGFANYWRILSFGARWDHLLLCVAICSAAGSGVALPLMNIIFGNLTGDFTSYSPGSESFSENGFKASISRNALFFVYLFIGKFILTYIGILCFRTIGLRISAALRLSYLKALFAQPVKKLDEVSVGTVANTITSSANDIQASISDRLSGLFQSLALVIAAYAIAFTYSWALTLAVSAGILFVLIALSITVPFVLKALQRVTKADEQHATVSSEALSSIRTVFALGAEPKMVERHSQGVNASHEGSMKLTKWIAIQLAPFYFAMYACYALAFWFGLKLYREGSIPSVTNVVVVFFSVLLVTTVLGQIAQPIMDINKAIIASVGFFEMMDSDRVQVDGLKEPEITAHEDIELKEVSFAYPTRPGVQVLDRFTATMQKGKTTALVGPSGSGKSTIASLLERWYRLDDELVLHKKEPVEGSNEKIPSTSVAEKIEDETLADLSGMITIGGHNINDVDLKWWRSQIGLVQQEPFLFNDTIANNVANGLIGTVWQDADETKKLDLIKEACVEAFADEFISKLPDGYSSKVGEGGIKLSGGQRQRIAIARSIVRKPAILILDEATSAIDVHGEKIVQAALDRASQNRTTIMIAHRLSTVRKADHIIVLRGGQKIEEGTHTELLTDENGLYSGLVRAQQIEATEHKLSKDGVDDEEEMPETDLRHISTNKSLAPSEGAINDKIDEESGLSSATYKRRGFLRSVGVFIREQHSKWIFFVAIILAAMGCGAAYALQSWLFAQLIQTFTFVGQQLVDAANFWSLMFFVLALAVTLCYCILTVASGVVSTHVGTSGRRGYFTNALKLPITYFDRDENASGSVMQRLSSDPKQVQDLLGVNSTFPLISVFNVVGCVILSFYYGWKFTLVVFFAVLPVIIGASFFRMRHEIQFEATNATVFATSSQFATEATSAFRTVSSLGMEDIVIKRYDKLLSDQVATSTRRASYAMLVYALADSIELCGMALAFWYGGQLLATGEYNVFQFFVIYAAIIQGSQAAGQYLSIIPNLAKATAAANRILEMRTLVKEDDCLDAQTKTAGVQSGAEISFKNITFRYPGVTTPLFSHLNIDISPGQFVAFVGPSGCGKTSTISLLERFYDPISGEIFVDGENIANFDTRTYRKKLALVSQEPRLFSGSIRSNLLLGVDELSVTEEDIVQACRDAEIHDFITSLPDGYGTELGQNTQTALSGGQKQRMCLARALLRKPHLLLLDEATSSLDSQSEKLVQGAIERLAGQRSMTVIAVAHRLATIQKADVIFVFGERDTESRKGSKIVERGSHSELFAKRGVYWTMCKAQALDR